jgi:hypothetical protein
MLLCGSAHAQTPAPVSHVTALTVAGTQAVGTFAGVAYTRTWGTVSGVVAPGEAVAGLAALPSDGDGMIAYTSPFEVIAPSAAPGDATVLVEIENRGTPLVLDSLDGITVSGPAATAAYPAGLGNGFLEQHHIAYARVAWQTGIATGVPASAQGIGEVIVRDFARVLRGERAGLRAESFDPGRYRVTVLGAISQSAWFVNSFIAEGFNVDPLGGHGVFDGAIAVDGTGHWLAINQLGAAAGAPQAPYLAPGAPVLQARAILKRPASDPFLIDIANYTDFFRLAAARTDTDALSPTMRRYDWPAPHTQIRSAAQAAAAFTADRDSGRCNGGTPVPLDPVIYDPYLRTVVVELAHHLHAPGFASDRDLPPTTLFDLEGRTISEDIDLRPHPGAPERKPLVDADGEPEGGVRFPESVAPLGAPDPPSIPPIVTAKLSDTCGNLGGWRALTAAEATARYASADRYVERVALALDELIRGGYLLPSERDPMLRSAAARYAALVAP